MVIKTDVCSFSEIRIYPGRGSRFVRKDGQLMIFASRKASSLYHQGKKANKLTWTTAWRRAHKKGATLAKGSRRRGGRNTKVARGISGISAEELAKRRQVKAAEGKRTYSQIRAKRTRKVTA